MSPDAAQLLAACRDQLVLGVATAFAGNLGKAHDDLLGMAERATSLEHQQLYFAALEFLANRGQVLLQELRATYVGQFDADLAGLRRGPPLERPSQFSELSLMDTEAFEHDLAVDKLSARAACNCANQLTGLERRLAALLRLPRVGQDDNPMSPRALFNAMLGALRTLGVGDALALALLQEFQRQTSVELPGIYNGLNQRLANAGVLPNISLVPTRPAPRGEVEGLPLEPDQQELRLEPQRPNEERVDVQGGWLPAGSPRADVTDLAAGAAGGASSKPPAGAEDLFLQLAHAVQAALGAASGDSSGVPLASAHLAPVPEANQLITALSSLQLGRATTLGLPDFGAVQINPVGLNALQQLRSTPLVNRSQPLDALTVDILGLLFEAIFKDPDLPKALRGEISKLQIPVLKAALLDRTFFSNPNDPARRLVDAIANAGMGRDAADERRLVEKVRTIVDGVVTGFDTDVTVFERQARSLESLLEEEELHAQSRTRELVAEQEAQESQAAARARVDKEIASRLRSPSLPILVADFLNRSWRLVLARAYTQGGERGDPWLQALATMDHLIWSVGPKRRAEDRGRLLKTLPGLLKQLRTDLEALGLKDAWDPFFAQLIRLHVAALRNATSVPEPPERAKDIHPPMSPGSQPPATQSDFRSLAQVDASTGIPFQPKGSAEESPSPHLPNKPPSEAVFDRDLQLIRSLRVGAWIELESDRGARKTLRLSWVSELRAVYLFTNRNGADALTFAATSLAERLRKGTARILSQDRLTDRAVARLLESPWSKRSLP